MNPLLRKYARLAVIALAVVALMVAATAATNAAGLTAIDIPGAGWAVGENDVPSNDLDAARGNASTLSTPTRADTTSSETELTINPVPDRGSAEEIAAVKAAAVRLLDQDLAAQTGDPSDAQVREILAAVWTPDTVAAHASDIIRGLAIGRTDSRFPVTTGHRIVVDRWLGVQAEPAAATLVFDGKRAFRYGGTWHDAAVRWRVNLVRVGSAWRIARSDELDIDGP